MAGSPPELVFPDMSLVYTPFVYQLSCIFIDTTTLLFASLTVLMTVEEDNNCAAATVTFGTAMAPADLVYGQEWTYDIGSKIFIDDTSCVMDVVCVDTAGLCDAVAQTTFSTGTFDAATNVLTVDTTNSVFFPPDDYAITFEIYSEGTKLEETTIWVKIVDPCLAPNYITVDSIGDIIV